tara:strand:+ start:37751 stop:38641 length:891 start_codon:yes stop_codon:yes gene_type:complete
VKQKATRIVLITGPSGAGRSTVLNAFEDMGLETIDNLPLEFLPRLLAGPTLGRDLALSVDVRTRDFSVKAVIEAVEMLQQREEYESSLFYVDCSTDVLLRRYSETRRRHPSAPDGSPASGIALEKDILHLLRHRADVYVNTTEMSPHDLRAEVTKLFGTEEARGLAVNLQSFSYKRGVPRGIDMVLDCRFLRNPYWDSNLRDKNGLDGAVQKYVKADALYDAFFDQTVKMAQLLLPAYRNEGKSHFTIGLGCTGGKHRSVTVTEELSKALMELGWQTSVRHREMERRALIARDAGV